MSQEFFSPGFSPIPTLWDFSRRPFPVCVPFSRHYLYLFFLFKRLSSVSNFFGGSAGILFFNLIAVSPFFPP